MKKTLYKSGKIKNKRHINKYTQTQSSIKKVPEKDTDIRTEFLHIDKIEVS